MQTRRPGRELLKGKQLRMECTVAPAGGHGPPKRRRGNAAQGSAQQHHPASNGNARGNGSAHSNGNMEGGSNNECTSAGGEVVVHEGVECDRCGVLPIRGLRFRSQVQRSMHRQRITAQHRVGAQR